jgi:hypothetical protein
MIGIVHRLSSFTRFTGSRNIVGGVGRWSSAISIRIGSDKSRLGTGSLGEAGSLGIDGCSGRITLSDLSDELGSWLTIDRRTLDNRLVFRVLSTSVGDIGKVAYDWIAASGSSRYIGKGRSVGSRRSSECPRGSLGDERSSARGLSDGLSSACTSRRKTIATHLFMFFTDQLSTSLVDRNDR